MTLKEAQEGKEYIIKNIETYDDARAMFVINSIEYWNYIP